METTLINIEQKYDKFKEQYYSKKARHEQLLERKYKLILQKEEINLEKELKEKSAEFLRMLGNYARKQAKENLEMMVTSALQFVFKEEIKFEIEFDPKRGRPEATFYIVNYYEDGTIVKTEPKDSRGGGVIDVISISLRIALAESFGLEGPFILDEPAKHLSEQYIPAFSDFLRQIADQFNRQIIMVTHNNSLAECGDISYYVDKKNGVSKVIIIPQNK